MTFSPPPPVAMHDLPLETIGNIVHLAYPANAAGKKQKRRRRFLLKASLVCRSWKPFAQKALWHSVRLDGSSIARFVASGAGRYPIKNLYVADVPSTSQDDPVDALLTSVRGVQHLSLSNLSCNGMSLSHRNFQDLKSLELIETSVTADEYPVLSQHLTTLATSYHHTPFPPQMLQALSRQVSITSHEFDLVDCADQVLRRISPYASQLVSLGFCIYYDPTFEGANILTCLD